MISRRHFLQHTGTIGALAAASPLMAGVSPASLDDAHAGNTQPRRVPAAGNFRFPQNFGIGGVAAGNGFHVNSDEKIRDTLEAAWSAGVRYFDTSPFYGFGLSERRMGGFLFNKNRADYFISSKVGRVFEADRRFNPETAGLWKGNLNFKFKFDYTAAGVRRSVEDSLQRLGLPSLDVVFVHDLSPDTGELKDTWKEQFKIAEKGAFPELTKMREEGLIKGWGLGVNTPEPMMQSLQSADPDVMLVAIQYSLMEHENALDKLFPAMQAKKVTAVIGGPLNAGFLAGVDRYNYSPGISTIALDKRSRMAAIAQRHGTDLRTVALQFCAAHPVVAAVIPGASHPSQAIANAVSMTTKIPAELWKELKAEKLIASHCPEPAVDGLRRPEPDPVTSPVRPS